MLFGLTRLANSAKIRQGSGVLVVLFGMLFCALPLCAQQEAASDTVEVRPTFDPLSIYKPSGGFGLGGGLDVRNLWLPGSRLTIDAYIAQHRGAYEIAFAPRDLLSEGLAGAVSVRYETQGRLPYYGIGPRTVDRVRLFINADMGDFAGHVGYRRGSTGVLGAVRFLSGTLSSYRNDTHNAFNRLDENSAARLADDQGERVSGASLGATFYADTRNDPYRPMSGALLYAGTEAFWGTAASSHSHLRHSLSASYHLPVGSVVLAFRSLAVHTQTRDDTALPILLLPRLSNRFVAGIGSGRLAANDILLFDVRAEAPIPTLVEDRVQSTGFVILSAFNAYDNLFTQARLVPSWADTFGPSRRYPLRSSIGVGMTGYSPETGRPIYTATVGYSADGIAASTLTLNLDPRQFRPLWRW